MTSWPELPLDAWRDTCATLHLWLQIVGKVRLAQTPWINHSWHVTLYPTATGLTTSAMPHGSRSFQIDVDLVGHALVVQTGEGRVERFALEPMSVATFYRRLMTTLDSLGLPVRIHRRPNEIADAVLFHEDEAHRSYDREFAARFGEILRQTSRVFTSFRAGFCGKSSPVHFFWGAPDLAVTRFSGRIAPPHPGGVPGLPDRVAREAYSHEVSSAGFWPGGGPVPYPVFYSYAYPEPEGFAAASVEPAEAFYSNDLREFLLPYDAVRLSPSPDDTLMAFLQSTYDAAARLGRWDAAGLTFSPPAPPRDGPG